jgi:hypothetical protein
VAVGGLESKPFEKGEKNYFQNSGKRCTIEILYQSIQSFYFTFYV